jgi:Na+-translocating ferredoxin:NAD+ oxidoreductase RnfG subunit
MIKVLIFILGFAFSTCIFAQAIDFNPKQIHSDIEKLQVSGIDTGIEILEIGLYNNNIVEEGKFFNVMNKSTDKIINHLYIGRVNSCRAGGCSIDQELIDNETSEYFDYYILFNLDCKISKVRIYNYQASHGQEVTSKNWLKQFIGFDDKSTLKVGKNVDAISGATISVYAITNDIESKTLLMRKLINTQRELGYEHSSLSTQ